MKTLKFGGTSLANAEKFIQVSSIIIHKAQNDQVSVVLSAPATITNYLEKSINKYIKHQKIPTKILITIKKFFLNLIQKIHLINPKYPINNIQKKIILEHEKLNNIFNKTLLSKKFSEEKQAKIISLGEILSVKIMKALLNTYNYKVTVINPTQIILATNNYLHATVDIKESKKRFQKLQLINKKILLMPGFIAGNISGKLVVLGRNGSDYSAAILSICTQSSVCEIWTDVNGIYTSDPNVIPEAQLISEITYKEALELAYLGATVLHPSTIEPLKKNNIPCIIKNTNNYKHPGTIISHKKNINHAITGITSFKKIIFIKIFGTKNVNIKKIIYKLFEYLSYTNTPIYLFNQSLSEKKISFYIKKNDSIDIEGELKKIFNKEIQEKLIEPMIILGNFSMLSIIGTRIKKNENEILNTVFSAINSFNNKIFDISYNTSNISLSIVLKNKKTTPIIKQIHNLIINKMKPINIFLIGTGGVGLELLKIFLKQSKKLKKQSIQLNINLIANSKQYIFNKKNINISIWQKKLKESNKKFYLEKILNLAKENGLFCPVLIDCTASQDISKKYNEIIQSGFHIVTANKKSNTSKFQDYKEIRQTAKTYNKKFFYETHVGAGLPIIQNLKNLINSGDKLIQFQGILSGSMSYIFGQLEDGYTLSEAIKKANQLGFTEPNPKDDLTGLDIARKLLILARESGYSIELSDIQIEKILPDYFENIKNKKNFLSELKKINHLFLQKVQNAQKEKKVLRCIGTIDKNGACNVKIHAVDKKNPLYHIKNGENIFVFYTKYYQPIPLILRGYGAGNKVTASGVFSDLLRIIS